MNEHRPKDDERSAAILDWSAHRLGRRKFFAAMGGSALVAAVLAACGKDDDSASSATEGGDTTAAPETTAVSSETTAAATETTAGTETSAPTEGGITGGGGGDGEIKIGWVSPQTGPLASFAAADDFIISGIEEFLAPGLMVGGKSYSVSIIRKDSESVPDTAASVALELINEDQVDLMLVGDTPETTNPVSDQCEANGVPCISSLAPWQPWFFGRGGTPDSQFQWTYHFFWGLEDIISTFVAMWDQIETNKQVGALFPNDGDGNAWGDAQNGLPGPMAEAGYTIVDPGRYENGNQDFTAQINAFKDANCEIVTGVVIPPDFPTFWRQAKQQGFVPKAATIAKAILFPESLEALGADGVNLTSEVWWSPNHPYSSSLTGVAAKDLADEYTAATGKQWTQPIGFVHALFEVAIATLVAAGSTDKTTVCDAIPTVNVDTIIGNVDWTSGTPVPNVAKTKLVGGQWREADTPTGYDLIIVDNTGNPDVPTAGTVEPI